MTPPLDYSGEDSEPIDRSRNVDMLGVENPLKRHVEGSTSFGIAPLSEARADFVPSRLAEGLRLYFGEALSRAALTY